MDYDLIVVLDMGGPQAGLLARKLRSIGYYCELQPIDVSIDLLRRKRARGLIIAGGPSEDKLDRALFTMGIPVLALGYAAVCAARTFGGVREGARLYDRAHTLHFLPCPLFKGLTGSTRFLHRVDRVLLPENMMPIAEELDDACPAFYDPTHRLYCLQFYPEANDPDGDAILDTFASDICSCKAEWGTQYYIDREIEYLRKTIGNDHAMVAISGGMDSTVCALLMHRAIGNRAHCVFVDTGLLRKNEVEDVEHLFRDILGMELIVTDRSSRILSSLHGVYAPAEKRSVVHGAIMDVMRTEAKLYPDVRFLAQGTEYSDLLRQTDPEEMPSSVPTELKLLLPLRMLFKEEIRRIGEALAIPDSLLRRQPFPGGGLAMRCIGEVTHERLSMLREADSIFSEEISASGLGKRLSRSFVILTDIVTNGPKGAGYTCVLRAVSSTSAGTSIVRLPYDLLDRVVRRITTETQGINRVLYDITGSASAGIEWT